MKTRLPILLVVLVLTILDFRISIGLAQGTAFTYQGQLTENGGPARGTYDLRFTLHDLPAGGSVLRGPVTFSPTVVNEGLFSVNLDFGSGIFTGAERWLEMAVRTNGGDAFIVLAPRQQISAAPYAMTAGELTGTVAAGQLTGIIQPGNIGAGSITSPMLASGSIHSNHLAIGSVHSNAFVLGSIHSNHLAVGSIHSNHLAAGSVHSNALAFGSVTATALASGSIHSNHLAIGSVHSNALVFGSIHSNHLAVGSIHSNHLAAGSVHSNALVFGSVTAAALASDSIHSNHLAFGSVHSNALVLGSIHSNHLAVGSIHSNHLAVGSVHSNALALGSVTADALASGSIHSNHLAFGSVHSNALVLGSIHSNHLAVGSIHSNHLAAGSVHSNALVLGSVTADALAFGSIHSNHLAIGSVHSNALVLGSIHSNHLAVGSIHSNHLAAGSVHSNALAFGSVTATALASGSIHSNHLAAGSVHSNALVVGSIHSNHLAAGSIHSNALALGSVTASALALGSIHSNHLAAGSVDSTALVIGSIHSNHLAVGAVSPDKLSASLSGSFSTSIPNPDPGFFEYFGGSVAALGTDQILVGAYQDSASWDNGGAAYLLRTNGTLLRTFLSPAPQNQEHFGFAVATVGQDKVLIGADGNTLGGVGSGAAYLFNTSGAHLTTFTNPTPAASDFFGYSVASVGADKVLIGAHGDHFGANAGGAAYLFTTNRTLLMTFNNPSPGSGDRFGIAVAALGADKVLIGADRDTNGTSSAGVAYLFHINGSLLATFANPTPASGDGFGSAIAAVGLTKVLIGAPGDNSDGNAGGAAYLFDASGALLKTLPNPTPASGDQFGIAVAAVGENSVLIGATADDSTVTDAGAAYLFSIDGLLLTTFNNPAPATGDFLGNAVAVLGTDQLVVGAWKDDGGPTDSGMVHLWSLESYVPSLMADTVRAGSITTSRLDDGAVTLAKLDPTIGVWTQSGGDVYRSSGKVGIGTASPQTALQVAGNNSQLTLHDTGRGNYWHIFTQNHPTASISGNLLFFPGPTGNYGYIQKSTGNYFSASDARLKQDVHTLSGVLDRVLQMRAVSYRFKSAPDSPTLGFIAQEVEPLFPEVVDDNDGRKSLTYSALVPVAIGAIQELHEKVKAGSEKAEAKSLKHDERIQKLETENAALRRSVEELTKLVGALSQKIEQRGR